MIRKYGFIVNPIAGQGAGRKVIPDIERLVKEKSLDHEIFITEHPGHAIELAQEVAIEGFEHVIAVGGDGTSNEVLNGIMQAWKLGYRQIKMGIIGIGRGNDFAYAFGIPPGLLAGFDIIQKNEPRYMDIGLVVGGDYPQGRYFGNGVGIGFDAVVGFEAAKLIHIHGFLNYIVAALRTIFLFFHAPNVKINFQDQVITQPALMVSIMNGRRMGGGFMMAPNALPDDGQLDICIAGQVSRIGILNLIPQFMKGTQGTHPQVTNLRTNKLQIIALEGSLPTHADGETICVAGKDLTIEIIHKPIQILCG